MKTKIIIALGATTLAVVLAAGISYAWFTDQEKSLPVDFGAGYVDILLEGNPDKKDSIFPAEEGKTIEYEVTNLSSKEVIVQFKPGVLTAYIMPDSYLDGEGYEGYILKDKHKIMKNLSPEAKMKIDGAVSEFVRSDNVPAEEVVSDVVDGWEFTDERSEYLGRDTDGNQYFRIQKDDTAKGVFKVALTADAGNKYQYAVFTIGEAAALATHESDDAIAAAFNGLDIDTLTK